MGRPVKDPVVVGVNRFINSVAIEKPVVENGNAGELFVNETVLEKDLHLLEGTV
jgi:hypothetical protein